MIIRPSTDLCGDYDYFSELAHKTGEPIYITKNGAGDVVLMSIEAYESRQQVMGIKETHYQKKEKKEENIMTEYTLGKILREMYETAPHGAQVANIHLFAIYYAEQIEQNGLNKKMILRAANLPESYQTEISKGINLSNYVEINDSQLSRIHRIQQFYET